MNAPQCYVTQPAALDEIAIPAFLRPAVVMPASRRPTSVIVWNPVLPHTLPGADAQVLIAHDEGTREGFLDGLDDTGEPIWRDVTALQVHGVTAWAHMPDGPSLNSPAP